MQKINTKEKYNILAQGSKRAKNGTYTMNNKMYGAVMGTAMVGETVGSIFNMINEFVYYSNPDNKSWGPTRYKASGMPFRPRVSRSMQQSYISSGPEYY